MERVNWLIRQPLYISSYQQLRELEKDRIFCCHQMNHLLDVARIAYIRNLENNLGIAKPVIYAAALLHDIGKAKQYTDSIPHEIAGAEIAESLLASMPAELSFTAEEQTCILTAIRNHRKPPKDHIAFTKDMSVSSDSLSDNMDSDILVRLIYESDKASRNCFCCPANTHCNWSAEQKNMEIKI